MFYSLPTAKLTPVTMQLHTMFESLPMQACVVPTLAKLTWHSFYPSILHQGNGFPLSNEYLGHWMSISE